MMACSDGAVFLCYVVFSVALLLVSSAALVICQSCYIVNAHIIKKRKLYYSFKWDWSYAVFILGII